MWELWDRNENYIIFNKCQLRTNMRGCFILPLSSHWVWKVVILSFLDYTTYMLQSIPPSSDYNQPQHLLLLLSVGTLTTDTNDLNSRKNILCGRKDIQTKIVQTDPSFKNFWSFPVHQSSAEYIIHEKIIVFFHVGLFCLHVSYDTWKHTVLFITSGV